MSPAADAHGSLPGFHEALAAWCLSARPRGLGRPWMLGVQGPQGCGKTTLAGHLVAAFEKAGLRSVAVSIDDFYLTHAEQTALAARHPGNPYLLYRGYPGTHDVALGARTLVGLSALGAGQRTRVVAYDKAAFGGRGDRAAEDAWRGVTGPLDVVLLEGWMLGFRPVGPAAAPPDLRLPDAALEGYRAWTERLDTFVQLDVDSPDGLDVIVAWRIDAERARRAAGQPALTDDEARDYIERFLPAYRLYLPRLRLEPPCPVGRRVLLGPDRGALGPPRPWPAPPGATT